MLIITLLLLPVVISIIAYAALAVNYIVQVPSTTTLMQEALPISNREIQFAYNRL